MADPNNNSDFVSRGDDNPGNPGPSDNGNVDEFGRPIAAAPPSDSGSPGGGPSDSGGGSDTGSGTGGPGGSGGPSDGGPGAGGGNTGLASVAGDAGPISIGLGDGASDGRLASADAGNGGDLAHVGAVDRADPLDITGLTGGASGDHAVTAGAGASGGPTLADAGILTDADGQSPLGAAIGNGDNIADASALGDNTSLQNAAAILQGLGLPGLDGGSGDHSLVATAGDAAGAPLANAGVLTSPDSQAPVATDIGSGDNLATAGLLPASDALSFPSLGGAGTDALTGLVPATGDLGNVADLGNVVDTSPATGDQSLIDAHTDGAPIAQVHDNSASLVGVNDHALV
jgi:hypothetical protein